MRVRVRACVRVCVHVCVHVPSRVPARTRLAPAVGPVHAFRDARAGFRKPVRLLTYTGTRTRDGGRLTPDHSYSLPLRACARTSTMSDTSSEASYATSLEEDSSVSASAGVRALALP